MPQNKYPNEEQTNPAEIFVSSTVEKMGQFSQFVSKLSGKRIKPGNFLARTSCHEILWVKVDDNALIYSTYLPHLTSAITDLVQKSLIAIAQSEISL